MGQIVPATAASPATEAAAPAKPAVPKDPLGRDTPFDCVSGFLDATAKGDYKRATRYLESKQPEAEEEELARKLSSVIDRGFTVDRNNLSREPEGELDDNGKPVTRVLWGRAEAGTDSLDINLDRVQTEARPVWLFSSTTLSRIPALADQLKPSWLEAKVNPHLAKWTSTTKVFSFPLARWIDLLLALLLAFGGAWLLSQAAFFVLDRAVRLGDGRISAGELRLTWPIRLVSLIIMVYALSGVAVSFVGRQLLAQIRYTLIVGLLLLIGMRWVDWLGRSAMKRSELSAGPGGSPSFI
jgi:MscS family membrane protein